MSSATATSTIPLSYRLLLTTVEPLFALGGVFLTLTDPPRYLHAMSHLPIRYDPRSAFIFTELSGAWLYFAFNEAVTLRILDNVRIWRLLCGGMLLSDICYAHSCAQALGGWGTWIRVAEWRVEDWTVLVTTAPFLIIRILIVLELGFKRTPEKGIKAVKKK